MPARTPAAIVVVLLLLFLTGGALLGARPAFNPSDVNKLEAAEQGLAVCEHQLTKLLDDLLDSSRGHKRVTPALVNKLEAIAHKFEVVERRVEEEIGPLADRHVEDPGPLPGLQPALDHLAARAESFAAELGRFLETAPPDMTPPEAFDIVQGIRDRIRESLFVLGLDYYRAVIPIRFVEFVPLGDPGIGGDRIKYSVEVTNRIFFPARLRFYVKKTITVTGSPFTHLFLTTPAGAESLDADGHRIHVDYAWPADWKSSPLVWPLHWPDVPQCSFQFPPPTPSGQFVETRYSAQERAGTYCCKEGEIIVFINKGVSNGGQYPWYTRIIGMSAHHMATRGSEWNKYVFAHEVGHYFGLPHTFPDLAHYGRDYDLARITVNPTEAVPVETIRRWYEPHANLVNVETGGMAPLSLFWDQVFLPRAGIGPPPPHLFFNSREEAAAHESGLQPIINWSSTMIFRPGQTCCGETVPFTRARHIVAANCLGAEFYYGDCTYPPEIYCTGDPQVRAFTQRASDPDRMRINVMNYSYPMGDGSSPPGDLVEDNFISRSQLEQIDRVMNPENDVVTRYYPDMTGMRPQLRSCEGCHSQVPGAAARKRDTPAKPEAKGAATALAVRPAFPNPTPHSTAVTFRLPEAGVVDLVVYDVAGRKVRAVEAGLRSAGEGKIVWDGLDDSGRRVPAGAYFYHLRIDERAVGSGKVVMVE